ncbi:MAG: hypothetical protein EPN25_13785 [Nitrospirae bacterium]|nr:MAG: hypothetical protein EPN25_13785 [Nitrospirota bacterium]
MKRVLLGALLLALVIAVPGPAMARVDVSVNIGLPSIVFAEPPELIVLPDTYVYVAPDSDIDLYFWNGWWWSFWEGRWYRSRYYDRGWAYYRTIPSFYYDVDPGWRGYYRDRNWYGNRWNYERIPHHRLQQNWRGWKNNRYWERQRLWGVESYQPRPKQQIQELRQQRRQQYQQAPAVQQPIQQPRVQQPVQRQIQPRVQQPMQQPREKVQQQQKQLPREKVQKQQKESHGKPEKGDDDKKDRR